MIYYETKATYQKDAGDGKMSKAKDVYLVRALSYSDAESHVIEYVSHYCFDGMPEIEIKKVKYLEVFCNESPEADKFYKVKAVFTTFDGEGDQMREKKTAQLFLVQAKSAEAAIKHFEQNMRGGMSDYTVHTVSETLILDYLDFGVADVIPAAHTAE